MTPHRVHHTAPPADLVIVTRLITSLIANDDNPRQHSAKQVRQISRSIQSFGFNVPILVDSNSRVIAGHGRLLACQALGWTHIPTIELDHLSDAQAQAFVIADNRLTDMSIWNERLLAEQLRDLSLMDLDFSIESTGFDMAEIDIRIEGLDLDAATQAEDDTDPVPSGPPVSMIGDLWQLGAHRLVCGDATDADPYARLMRQERAAMVFIDPPYNVAIGGNVGGLGSIQHREFVMASGEMTPAAFTGFLSQAFSALAQHSADGSLHYICMDWRHLEELLAAGRAAYTELKNLCVWAKTTAGMGSLYRSQHELVFVFKNGTAPHRNNVELGRHGRNRTNVWQYASPTAFGRAGDEGNLLALHPTVKPVDLIADAILDCTARNDIVLDVFLGSGSTMIAAEKVGRRCYALELDPLYVDTAIRRWQRMTGRDAIRDGSGTSFNVVAQTSDHDG